MISGAYHSIEFISTKPLKEEILMANSI